MPTWAVLALAVLALATGADPRMARADDATPPATVRFTSLAPDGLRSEANFELVTGDLATELSGIDATGVQVDAQYLVTRSAGAYARLGLAFVSSQFESSTTLAGAEVGALQRIRVRDLWITGRVGVALPIEPDFFDPAMGARSVVRARRPSDLAWLPDPWLENQPRLRLAVTPTFARGPWSARMDVGLDAWLARSPDHKPTYHIDLAVGARHRKAGATVEFSTFGWSDDWIGYFRHAVTLGAQYQLGRAVLSLRLGTPFTTGHFPDSSAPPGFVRIDPVPIAVGELVALTFGTSVAL